MRVSAKMGALGNHHRSSMKTWSCVILASFSGIVSLGLWGCATPTVTPPQQVTARVTVPVVSPLPETQEAQEKGGLEIAVTPTVYTAEKYEKTTTRQTSPSMGGILVASLATGGNAAQQIWVTVTKEQQLRVKPGRLQFSVRINNKLARVFRGQGAVVQFNVAGKLQPFGETDYKEFVDGIVPPRNESTFTILGPSIGSLPDQCTIGIYLYDVVTATDVAGNVTERQNYEWFFKYETHVVEQTVERSSADGFVDVDTYQRLMLKEREQNVLGTAVPQS